MPLVRLVLVAAIAAATVSSPALAQSAIGVRTSGVRASGAPVASQLTVGARKALVAPAPTAGKPAPVRQDTRQNRALMIFGGAGMLTGAVVGGNPGTLISVGGAVVFLWGLYQYLQ